MRDVYFSLPPPIRALLWMAGAIASFTLLAVTSREVTYELTTFELIAYRSYLGILLIVAGNAVLGRTPRLGFSCFWLECFRNSFQLMGMSLWIFAIANIPLAQVFALEFMTPAWAAIMAALYLGERLTCMQVLAIAIGAVGVVVVVRPGTLEFTAGTWAAALCAVGFAGSAVLTRKLTRYESAMEIVLWMQILQAIAGTVVSLSDGQMALPGVNTLLPLLLACVTGLSAHYCLTRALALAPASVVSPIDFIRLPIIATIGVLFYNEPFETAVLIGGGIICFANYLNIRSRLRAVRERR